MLLMRGYFNKAMAMADYSMKLYLSAFYIYVFLWHEQGVVIGRLWQKPGEKLYHYCYSAYIV